MTGLYIPLTDFSPNFTEYLTHLVIQSCVSNWVCLPPPNTHDGILGICAALPLIIGDLLQNHFVHIFKNSYVCFQLPEVPKRSLVSLDIAGIFEPTLASVLRNKCINSCLLILLSTTSVCAPAIATTRYNLTKNKSIALLTRQLTGTITAFNFFLCASAL